jgi:hypothetical protein
MTTSADNYIWDSAISQEFPGMPFSEKQRLWIQDQSTGGNYNGVLQYDLTSWSNSGLYVDYSSAVLQIPYVVSIKGSNNDNYNDSINKDTLNLKNHFANLIDQIQVDVNNKTVCQTSSNVNLLANIKMLATFDQSTLSKLGASLGIALDTDTSASYSAAASVNGIGYINNTSSNLGLVERKSNMTAARTDMPTIGTTTAILASEGRNYYVTNGLAGDATTYHYIFLATIRLRDLSDFFDIPISRGLQVRMSITYNSFKATIASTITTNVLSISAYQQLSGTTCPIILSALTLGTIPIPTGTLDITGNVVSNSISVLEAVAKTAFNSTRIYIDAYKLNPDYQAVLLKEMPVTTHKYLDYYSYNISSVASGATFNQIVSNGIPAIRAVFIMPFSPIANLVTAFQNPFSSVPSTTLPGAPISQLNILVGGLNLFSQNQTYTFENYLSELQHIFAVNGGKNDSVNCGLISRRMFENNYRFYCASIRRNPIEDNIPKSLQVTGVNASATAVQYTVIVLFEKSVTLNTATGEILSTIP